MATRLSLLRAGLTASAAMALASCSSSSFNVRQGDSPANIDRDVRFRTTYYFRVFDACYRREQSDPTNLRTDSVLGGKKDGPFILQTDSLYRFIMTGKASGLFNATHFESGTLRKEEIDPFGARIVADKNTGALSFQSRAETERQAQISRDRDELTQLAKLRDTVGQAAGATAALDNLITSKIGDLAAASGGTHPPPSPIEQDQEAVDLAKQVGSIEATATALSGRVAALGNSEVALVNKPDDLPDPPKGDALKAFENTDESTKAEVPAFADAVSKLADAKVTVSDAWNVDNLDALNAKLEKLGTFQSQSHRMRSNAELVANDKSVNADLTQTVAAAKTFDDALAAALFRLNAKALGFALTAGGSNISSLKDVLASTAEWPKDTLDQREKAAKYAQNALAEQIAQTVYDADPSEANKSQLLTAVQTAAPTRADFQAATTTAATASDAVAKSATTMLASITKAADIVKGMSGSTLPNAQQQTFLTTQGDIAKAADDAAALAHALDGAIAEGKHLAQVAGKGAAPAGGYGGSGTQKSPSCPPGFVQQRGFQVLGPEGLRTFDQDERLIMAMSSSAKPLISTLQDLAGRALNAHPAPAQVLLPLVEERLRISEAERTLDASNNNLTPDAFNQVIASFKGDGATGAQ